MICDNEGCPTVRVPEANDKSRKAEDMHLVTYDIPTAKCMDHGAISLSNGGRPVSVNSIAIGKGGTVYALAKIAENGRERTDLISIAP